MRLSSLLQRSWLGCKHTSANCLLRDMEKLFSLLIIPPHSRRPHVGGNEWFPYYSVTLQVISNPTHCSFLPPTITFGLGIVRLADLYVDEALGTNIR